MRYLDIPAAEITRFIQEELPGYYSYTTKIMTYTDRASTPHAHIEIRGTIGIRGELNRYNPLDRTFIIRTENPKCS